MRVAVSAVVLVGALVLSGIPLLPSAAAEDGSGFDYGPKDWQIGISWNWDNGTTLQETRVTDQKTLQTRWGQYETFITRSRRAEGDGTEYLRMTSWLEGSHRRAYDEVHIYRAGQEPVTAHTAYKDPVAFPFWETMHPGASVQEEVTTITRYTVGLQPAGREVHNWTWTAWADNDVINVTTPAGTYEGYNVTVHKERHDGNKTQMFRYFYAPNASTFQATYNGDGSLDFQLTDLTLNPPPDPHATYSPRVPRVGQTVTLDASHSVDRDGNITGYNWTLPNGTVLTGPRVNTTFDEPGRHRITLGVTDDHHQTTNITVTVRVVDRSPNFKVAGPSVLLVQEDGAFRLVPPEGREVRRATWEGSGIGSHQGEQVDLSFPREGRYNITVTFMDSEGSTGRLHHQVTVVEGERARSEGSNGSYDPSVDDLGPRILNPETETRISAKQTLVVARTIGLSDPAIVLGNGLRVPLEADAEIATAQVPLSGEKTTLQLVENHSRVDSVVVYPTTDAVTNEGDASNTTDTNSTPFPVVTFLLIVPFLRRRER